MFQSLKDKLHFHWQGRFRYGFNIGIGGVGLNRYDNGAFVFTTTGPTFISGGTGHWPWYMWDVAVANGPRPSWHIGVLGFTIGKVIINSYDDKLGEIVGPDRSKYYFFFKGINHQSKEFEEIIL